MDEYGHKEVRTIVLKMKRTTTKLKQKNVEPKLKVWLLRGRSITHNQAQKMWGTNRLAEFVRRLRRKGMNIDTEMVVENGETFGVYKLREQKKQSRIATKEYIRH